MAPAGGLSRNAFRDVLEPMLEKRRRTGLLSEAGAAEIRRKGGELIALFAELDRREMLRSHDDIDFTSIGNVLRNFDEVNQLNGTLLRLYKASREKGRTRPAVPFRDEAGNTYAVSQGQLVIQWGWAYCSLCEVMKTVMTGLVRFPAKPIGIGEVIMALERAGGLEMSYFDFVDPGVRNAFFHLDFCHEGGEIRIAGRREPLAVAELVERATKIDAVVYPMIAMLQMLIGKKG
jgi:hypothetical protein